MTLKHAIVHLLFAVACSTFQKGEGLDYLQDDEFIEWVSKYYKHGENLAEVYPTWRSNADFVKHQNSLGLTYTLSVNKFAHLSSSDLIRGGSNMATSPLEWSDPAASYDIPSSTVDWRDKGVVPPVVNQGECGDSRLFATVDAIDAFWAINHGDQLTLASYQECMDCCYNRDNGCNGGLLDQSIYQCIVRLGGLAREGEYMSPNHTCLSNKYPAVVKISGSRGVVPAGSEEALAAAVARQPVVATVDASHSSFQLYQSGIYYDPDCSVERLDHAMLVVGYGSDQDGQDYWIVKNSWGKSWGMQGYILLARNKNNNCGIATLATYPY